MSGHNDHVNLFGSHWAWLQMEMRGWGLKRRRRKVVGGVEYSTRVGTENKTELSGWGLKLRIA